MTRKHDSLSPLFISSSAMFSRASRADLRSALLVKNKWHGGITLNIYRNNEEE